MKVLQKIQAATAANDDRAVFSFEFFPPKTDGGVHNLFERMRRMVAHGPAFCDITWGAGGSTADLTLEIADRMQNTVRVETMMHLTCTNAPLEKIDHALTTIKSNGIQNVLALRGDPSLGKVEGGYRFACALDLVEHIRSKHGDYFGITVAGYPEGHPDVIQDGVVSPEAYQSDLAYLKRKVDAGADVIVTQLFYDVDIFLKFVNDCRQIGITCPIVPGIMPIHNYKGFIRIADFNKSKIPPEIMAALELIKDDEEAVMAYGVHLGAEMCRKIMASGIRTIHLYTLNMEKSALAILMSLGLIEESKISRPPTNVFRVKEDIVRPMFCTPMESVNFGRPSKLEYEDKLCQFCSKELQIRVVSSAFNFQKLYYYCDHHRFVSWCHPINEEEVDHDPIEMDFKANKMKILKELKNLRNKYDDLARLIKVVLMVILINMTMSMCNSCFA